MADPNIVNVTTITGKTAASTLTASAASQVTNSSASGKVFKINTIIASNKSGSTTTQVNVGYVKGGVTYYIARTIDVPADSSVVILDKNTSIYLQENESISAFAATASIIDLTVSYEEIS
jgi:hypothetical protein